MAQTDNYYQVLGVSTDATADEIVAAYRTAIRKAHPDMPGGSTERTQALNDAYRILNDPVARAQYDTVLTPTQYKVASAAAMSPAYDREQANLVHQANQERLRARNQALFTDVTEYHMGRYQLLKYPKIEVSADGKTYKAPMVQADDDFSVFRRKTLANTSTILWVVASIVGCVGLTVLSLLATMLTYTTAGKVIFFIGMVCFASSFLPLLVRIFWNKPLTYQVPDFIRARYGIELCQESQAKVREASGQKFRAGSL